MSGFAAQTDVGLLRTQNQDEAVATELPGGAVLLAVADGVGGSPGGDVASLTAMSALVRELTERGPAQMEAAIASANEEVLALQKTRLEWINMATTLVAATIEGHAARIANLGDSRAYVLIDGRLKQVSRDDSWVSDVVESGELTLEQAERHPYRNVVTRGIGIAGAAQPTFYDVGLGPGDAILLATDGLFKMVPDEEIERLLAGNQGAEKAAAALVDAANAAGGMDNIGVAIYFA